MKSKMLIVALVIVGVIGLGASTAIRNQETKEVVKTVYVGNKEEKLENFSREDSVESLRKLMLAVSKDAKNRSYEERIKEVEDGKDIYDVLSAEAVAGLYMSEEFNEDKFNRQVTASTVLMLASIMEDNLDNEFTPEIQLYNEIVYFDPVVMNAFIPLDVFLGMGTGYALEMQYNDGEWKLSPYSIIMSMKLSEMLLNAE